MTRMTRITTDFKKYVSGFWDLSLSKYVNMQTQFVSAKIGVIRVIRVLLLT